MSDTSGATDLKPDTPPINAAPPVTGIARSPMQLPSALQGLAKFFTQSQPQGGPAPKPKQQQPPPLTEEQASKPPIQTGRPGSFAPVPPTAPIPPAQFTPHIGATNDRPYSEWGKPEQFPRTPQTFELPGMYSQIGNSFEQGGGFIGVIARALSGSSKDYLDGFMKRQEWKMRMALDEVKLKSAQLEELEGRRATEYSDTYDGYFESAGGDLNKLPTTTVKGVNLYDAMHAKALELDDPQIAGMLEDGKPMTVIMRTLADRDRNFRNLSAANKKTREQEVDDGLFGLSPRDSAGDADPTARFRRPLDAAVDAPATPPTTPETARAPGPPKPDEAPSGELDPNVPQPLKDEGANVAKGIEPPSYFTQEEKRVAARYALDLNKRLDQIANDPKIKPEDVIPLVKKLNPSIGNQLEDYADYRKGPGATGSSGGGKEQDYWSRLGTLAAKARPGDPANNIGGWNATNFRQLQEFRDPNGKVQTAIGRSATVSTTGAQLMAAVNALPDQSAGAMQRAWDAFQGGTLSDPRYVAVFNAWQRYNMETNVLIRGGTGGITETESSVGNVKPWGGPAAYRTAIKQDAENSLTRLRQYKHQWAQLGSPDPMPGDDNNSELGLNILSKIDPNDGSITAPDGTKRRYLGLNPTDPMARENWQTVS